MLIEKLNHEFVISFDYDPQLVAAVKSLPDRRWHAASKTWRVPETGAKTLQTLVERLNGEVEYRNGAREAMEASVAQAEQLIQASKAADADIEIPVPAGLDYMPFQRAGIAYALERQNVLLGDQMGLGKTIQAVGVSNADVSIQSVLIICPASLRINWMREWAKWDVKGLSVGIANGALPDTQAVILNYDVLKKHSADIHSRQWDLLICDEAHYLKNPKAQRTNLVLGKWHRDSSKAIPAIKARRKLFLTGTPIPNRPIEGWTIFHALAPDAFSSWKQYATRYCKAYQSRYGWDVSGASNLGELQEKLRASVLVRRLKEDVLKELPAKRRQVIELSGDFPEIAAEQAAWNARTEQLATLRGAVQMAKSGTEEEYAVAVSALREGTQTAFSEMSRLRHATALAKVPVVVEHLGNAVEEGKVICFAHHRDVISNILEAFPDAVSITGDTKLEDRQAAVDRFQRDPRCRLFVGNIQAAGVGITLTASSHVVFAELDWVPGNVTQAEDRAHRIGQDQSVLIQHLVLEGSLDAVMAKRLVQKQSVIDQALDDTPEIKQEPLLPIAPTEEAATESTSRKKIAELAAKMTDSQIAAVHLGLQMLSGMCDGARSLDGSGFNKLDARIGKSLAESPALSPKQAALGYRLIHKYRRQLPEDIIQRSVQ